MTKNEPNYHCAMEILEPLYISATKPSSNNASTPHAVPSSYDVTPIIHPPSTCQNDNYHSHHRYHPYRLSNDTNTETTVSDTLGFSLASGTTVSTTFRRWFFSYSKVWNRHLNTLVYLVRNQRQKRRE